jgi:hypothetical protein
LKLVEVSSGRVERAAGKELFVSEAGKPVFAVFSAGGLELFVGDTTTNAIWAYRIK